MNSGSSSSRTPQLVVAPSGPTPMRERAFVRLPDELLRMVFGYDVLPRRQDIVWWISNGRDGDYDTATRALILARVCRQWRYIALGMRNLWTTVRIPPKIWRVGAVATAQVLLDVLKSILNNSGDALLSVILPWDIEGVQWPAGGSIPPAAQVVFSELSGHADRWQRFNFQAPPEGVRRWMLSRLFARPTPALEFVHVSVSRRLISSTGEIRHDPNPLYGLLPACPRLHTAYLGADCFFPFQTAAPALVDLAVDSHMTHVELWDILANAPHLRTLRLALTCGMNGGDVPVVDALVAAPIVLASLEHLEVRSHLLSKTLKLAALYIRTPNLSRLSLPHSMIWKTKCLRRVKGFIRVNGNALTELTVREDMPARSYDNPATLGVADFWVSLKTETPQLAPGLRKLFMLGIVDIPGPHGLQAYNDFKAARNDAALNDEERLEVTEQWDHPPEVTRKPIVRGQPGKGLLAGYRPRY